MLTVSREYTRWRENQWGVGGRRLGALVHVYCTWTYQGRIREDRVHATWS